MTTFPLLLLAIVLASTMAPFQCEAFIPNYQGCMNQSAFLLPYCATSLSHEARVADLVQRLTLEEKVSLISPDPNYGTCNVPTAPVERLGVPRYMWLVETNTGVASACMGPNKCATTFPGPPGLGAAFNRTMWQAKGDVISSELRAFSNAHWYRGVGDQPWGFYKIGMDGFGPNMNIVRDPRFGRNSELPGEDPFLTGSYATAYVQGMQQVDNAGYVKMLAYLKHFDAYSRETDRGHDTYNITQFDFWDTYLPAYEMAFTKGGASGAMCSYNAENGHPSCANGWLLNDVIRSKWQRPNALIMTDCGAIPNMLGPPLHADSGLQAAAWSINNGTDIEAGSTLWGQFMAVAVKTGLVNESKVDESVTRAMLDLMRAGRFDKPSDVSWTSIGTDVINSTAHQKVNFDAALQSFVLLENDGVLPIKKGSHIAVVGPQGSARYGMLSDYYGDQVCYAPGERADNKVWDCIPTVAEALRQRNDGGIVVNATGVTVQTNDTSHIAEALAVAKAADVVVMVLGINHNVEHEGIDRTSITLPGIQEPFAHQVLALGKPTVLVLINGGEVAIDTLKTGPNAIVEAFYPSVAGNYALAATLLGEANKWGKLPITMYPADYIQKVSMTNYHFSDPPGRSYRYYTGTPLWPFGYGLSYTTFSLACTRLELETTTVYNFSCDVTNTGKTLGDEVIQVYHIAGSDIRSRVHHPVPIKQLVGFQRVTAAPGAKATSRFNFDQTALQLTDSTGAKVVYAGTHQLVFSRGHGQDVAFTITISSPGQ